MKKKKPRFSFGNFWKKWFFSKRKKNSLSHPVEPDREDPGPESFERELEKAKIKFRNFHITRFMKSGEEIRRKDYTLKKTSLKTYRLEGKDFQLVLVTGNYLRKKDGKTTGVLVLKEEELNRAIQREHAELDSFLGLWKPVLTQDTCDSDETGWEEDNSKILDWKVVLGWDIFWKQRLLSALRPDTVALLLVSLGNDFREFVWLNSTQKQKKLYHDELYYLNRGRNSKEWNPYSKNKTLVEPDAALEEFLIQIMKIQRLREV